MNKLKQDLSDNTIQIKPVHLTSKMLLELGDRSYAAERNQKHIDAYTFIYEVGGLHISGFLVAPKTINKKLPVIVFNRGGVADFGLVPERRLFTRVAEMARWGYIVIGSQYPGNSLSDGFDERGGETDIASILKLKEIIDSLSDTDSKNIGMYGESRGGMMTYLCMKQIDWIKTALTVGGLANLDRTLLHRPEMVQVYEKHFNNTESARNSRSAVRWADVLNNNIPLALLHGSADENVNIEDAHELAGELKKANHPHALFELAGGDHGLTNVSEQRDEIIRSWFGKYLQG